MSATAEFPGNCITNIHILHDFAEIAYIVCTHAIPANTDSVSDANSPDKILDRLRNAEKQFRQHSILVALDAEKLELFTFYRKVDVVKDQRTILNKFGYVCRLNSCIVSAKSAARVLELLKPESSRIFRLFTSAVLSSIQILPRSREATISVGTRVYLVPGIPEDRAQGAGSLGFCPEWQLHRVNLQVIATGQLVLTVQNAKNAVLQLLSDMEAEQGITSPLPGSLLYLTPTGQIARFSTGLTGTKSELAESLKAIGSSGQDDKRIAIAQITLVSNWLQDKQGALAVEINELTRWIQVEIAVVETKEDIAAPSNRALAWKRLMWPSSMIYVFKKTGKFRNTSKANAIETDPLKFTLDWYNSSAERNGQFTRAQASKDNKDDADDEHVFTEEVHFEDHFNTSTSAPPIFPASQTVYPTPPEAAITHQTPGMSSVDGLDPTHANVHMVSQPDSEPFLDQEMADMHEQQPERIGTGFYDEDLFEEMPDDKFAPSADANEPDWDFFDAPGFAPTENTSEAPAHVQSSPALPIAQADVPANGNLSKDDEFPELESAILNKQSQISLDDTNGLRTSPGKIDALYADEFSVSPTTFHHMDYVGKPLTHLSDRGVTALSAQQHFIEDQPPNAHDSRRRSSVFEGVPFGVVSQDHDSRYSKHGKFWFDNEPAAKFKDIPELMGGSKKRPPSSASDSSFASSRSDSDASLTANPLEAPSNKRTWTHYQPESPAEEQVRTNEINQQQVEAEVNNLLSIVEMSTGEDPFLLQIEPIGNARRRPNYGVQKTMMVAQVLVDQVSQASLLRYEYSMQLHRKENPLRVDISMDHSGARTPISHASLAELTTTPTRTTSKLINLSSRLICVNRADLKIVARSSILPFWDTLGLQPHSETKDITAFCVHPSSSNVSEGCTTLLSRIADTYASCNLGTHTTGRLPGLTVDGLLAWKSQSAPGPNLKQLCQRLGSAIGAPNAVTDKTIIVYMISPSKDSQWYRELCHAFTVLFEAFVDTSEGLKRNTELVLQIVPLEFVASPETLSVPNQSAYLELALEVYNRVPIKKVEVAVASCGSAVILEKHQIREPSFELSNTVISPLSKDGPCLHMAYSYSTDKKWLTAAWSDECGLVAFTMSYCLAVTNGGKKHSKRDVFRSIWEISHDMMHRSRIKWRLAIAQTGFYEAEDVVEWQQLVVQSLEDRKSMSRLILLSVDLNPDIVVEPPVTAVKPVAPPSTSQIHNTSGTPATTPQANMTSPDQVIAATPTSGTVSHVNVSTPPEQSVESAQDTETMLIDPTDQSWAATLGFGLNQSSNLLDVRPAAASGLLIKRAGSKDENKYLQLLGVNLVAAPRSQPTSLSMSEREAILQEMMDQYRGLVTLAISRGCIDKNFDLVPWHIATAVKGSRVLGEAM